ncbi:GIY-YIG nuclease family protein [Roseobacter litoralis]|uniref:GIY-YIG nuclease family protein n=1 Tax=Roseobacter litoralis TaxID=42443 RepID=UPI002494E2EF|nr:hypothetical protein [Roseobacter litoralis]
MIEGTSSGTPSDLTHSLTDDAKAFLSPAKLVLLADILRHIDEHSITHGLYGWWFDGNLPFVPRDGCIAHKGKHLLYVGIAPPKDGPARSNSSTPMKRRLWRNHLNGTVRSSTLRLSVAALLQHDLNLAFWRDTRRRVRMDREHEAKLTAWIERHATVSVMQHENPSSLEEKLIKRGPPLPLNLSMSSHPFKATLSDLRRALGRN